MFDEDNNSNFKTQDFINALYQNSKLFCETYSLPLILNIYMPKKLPDYIGEVSYENYLLAKKMVEYFETSLKKLPNQPYLVTAEVRMERAYNPDYDEDAECECGHPYYRHFDSYEDMDPCGCKYCRCSTFILKQTNENSIK